MKGILRAGVLACLFAWAAACSNSKGPAGPSNTSTTSTSTSTSSIVQYDDICSSDVDVHVDVDVDVHVDKFQYHDISIPGELQDGPLGSRVRAQFLRDECILPRSRQSVVAGPEHADGGS